MYYCWHIADAKVNKIRRVWGNIYVILGYIQGIFRYLGISKLHD